MKGIRSVLKTSFLGGVLAAVASGPLSAATFALTDDIELENVSAAASMDRESVVQINYAARQPHFLLPLVGADALSENDVPAGLVKIWMSPDSPLEIPLTARDSGYASLDMPRLRWMEASVRPTIAYVPSDSDAQSDVFPVSAELTWPEPSAEATNPTDLQPFVVSDADTTCGFPNDFFDFASSPSARAGLVWAKTANFAPHPHGGPSVPKLPNVTWLTMPMPHVVGYSIGNANHAAAPESPYLRFEDVPSTEDSMTVGFHQKSEVFRCRVYASGTRSRLDLPNNPSAFGDNRVASFGFEPFPLIPAEVPLPAGSMLLLTGLAGLAAYGRKAQKA